MRTARRGIAVLELVVASALLGTLLIVCLQLLSVAAAQRRAADERQLALIEASNVVERLAVRPWNELTPKMPLPQLSPAVGSRLPGSELSVEVTAPDAQPDLKRIVVSLRWQDRAGQYVSPVKITTWRWKLKEQGTKKG
jgi:hypothetical protein